MLSAALLAGRLPPKAKFRADDEISIGDPGTESILFVLLVYSAWHKSILSHCPLWTLSTVVPSHLMKRTDNTALQGRAMPAGRWRPGWRTPTWLRDPRPGSRHRVALPG